MQQANSEPAGIRAPRWRLREALAVFGASINPRRSLAASTGWSIAAVTLIAALLSGAWAGLAARSAIEREIGLFFAAHAQRLMDTIDTNLAARRQWIAATARVMGPASLNWTIETRQTVLDDLRKDMPEIEWVGIADVLGRVIAGSGGRLAGYSVESLPWFTGAFVGPFVDTVHSELQVTGATGRGPLAGEPRRLVDMAAPLVDRAGEIGGILGMSLGWSWIETLRANAVTALAGRDRIEVLLVSADGIVLLGSDAIPTGSRYEIGMRVGGEHAEVIGGYLAGIARSRGFGTFPGLGWHAIVREPSSAAFAPAYRASLIMFGIVMGFGVLAALFGAWIAGRIMRRLKGLAIAADNLRLGRTEALSVPSGNDEAGRISRSLVALVGALQASNEELDRRVADRTRQIERMGEETRSAALVRERLRIARDLHDTLAHSLLALLTQIRFVRKLAVSRPKGVDRELELAEEAARDGLQMARGALMGLRHSPVKVFGLGAAMERLAGQITERITIKVDCDVADDVRSFADSRTEVAFRIAEEAVRNVEKHAEAGRLCLHASLIDLDGERHLEIRVSDDGRGFDPSSASSDRFGLVGAREQAELVGGSLRLESRTGGGTTVIFTMPL